MRHGRETTLFWGALVTSALAHGLTPLLESSEVAAQEPSLALEETEVRPPMTVRFVTETPEPQPPAQEVPLPVVTADDGARRVLDLPVELERLERQRPEDEPLPKALVPPEPDEREEPPPPVEPLPIAPPVPQPPPPAESVPLPTEPRSEDIDVELASPRSQDAQSAVTAAKARDSVNTPPPYPIRALRRRMEVTVRLSVTIDRAGRVERLHVLESSGHDLLDDQALKYVKRWRFDPARDGQGRAIETVQEVPVRFDLTDR